MKISVIIPTYNRAQVLKRCLEHLFADFRVIPHEHQLEVIVVNDGSTDETEEIINDFLKKKVDQQNPNQKLIYLKQENKKQAAARNNGMDKVSGEVVVFIGDDIFIQPGYFRKLIGFHKRHPQKNKALLGYTTWHPELKINRYMEFLENSGIQFAYHYLNRLVKKSSQAGVEKEWLINLPRPYRFFYTSNVSLKTDLIKNLRFDESFKSYGYEDIAFGKILAEKENMELYYLSTLKAYHFEHHTEANLDRRMKALAQSSEFFPEAQPRGLKKILYFLISVLRLDRWPIWTYHRKMLLKSKRFFWNYLTK